MSLPFGVGLHFFLCSRERELGVWTLGVRVCARLPAEKHPEQIGFPPTQPWGSRSVARLLWTASRNGWVFRSDRLIPRSSPTAAGAFPGGVK